MIGCLNLRNHDLDFGQIVFGVPSKNHSGPFAINLADRKQYLIILFLYIVHDFGIGPAEMLIGPLVDQVNAFACRQPVNYNAFCR
jgi:hypothetical protein